MSEATISPAPFAALESAASAPTTNVRSSMATVVELIVVVVPLTVKSPVTVMSPATVKSLPTVALALVDNELKEPAPELDTLPTVAAPVIVMASGKPTVHASAASETVISLLVPDRLL